jgi:hypothetical protein
MNGVPQQADFRRRVQSRRLKVVGVGAGDGDTEFEAVIQANVPKIINS